MNIGDIANRSIHLMIEEPELSMFPTAQRSSLNMLIDKCLNGNKYMTLTLATHSPYIINHLNLLLKAFDKGVKIENAALDYHKTEVYVVEHGMVKSIKVQNAHLINTDYLSDDINEIYNEYDKLDEITMIDLLKRELPSHYKLHRTIVDVPYEITAEEHFDLTDRGLTSIVDYKTGNISFDHSNRTEVQVINYEAYLIGLEGNKI